VLFLYKKFVPTINGTIQNIGAITVQAATKYKEGKAANNIFVKDVQRSRGKKESELSRFEIYTGFWPSVIFPKRIWRETKS